jgi:O-antigen biosynthesis protein
MPALRAAAADTLLLNRQYRLWLEQHRLSPAQIEACREDLNTFARTPLISVLMPVFNTDADWLTTAVESVRHQIYPYWELCLVDDASTKVHIAPLLARLSSSDPRIKLKSLATNEGISGASNHALSLASGEFVGLVDHDDRLAPEALYEVVKRLNTDPTIDFVYTDHDLFDSNGDRRSPFFKPDWSPDLLLSMNYITHFCLYRRELVERVGGFRKGLEGSQDYDLILRVTEYARRIEHIAHPLYSWGQAPASVASNPKAKPYAHEAGRRALQETLVRRGIGGEVVDGYGSPYRYRVKRKIAGEPMVSIIIPTRDNWRLLKRCIDSLETRTTYRHFEVLVVDNQSREPETLKYLAQLSHRVIPFAEPFNFARMNNVAAAQADGEHLLFLNDDTEVIEPDWLTSMLEHSQRPEVGAVGARLLFPDKTIQHAGVVIGIQGKAGHAFWGFPADHPGYYDLARVIRNYSAVTGACLMVARAAFEAIGGFDEAFEISYNDVDLCLRLRQHGYLIVYTPYAVLYHYQSASRGAYNPETDRKYEELLRGRWNSLFEEGDPYYNPNLTLTGFDFSLRS